MQDFMICPNPDLATHECINEKCPFWEIVYRTHSWGCGWVSSFRDGMEKGISISILGEYEED